MLDAAVALAVQTELEVGARYATIDLKITYLRPITAASGPIRAEGILISKGSRLVLGEGRLTDREGRLCAHAVCTCLVSDATGQRN